MRRLFATDLRSLAAFRIAVALLLLVDLIDRARDLTVHYTDFGVFPRAAFSALSGYSDFSFHALGGSTAFEAILFTLAGGFALLLLAGRWTRVASVASWIFLVSLHHRNGYVLYGGDLFLRLLVFWGMFLPWGVRYSMDARTSRAPGNEVVSIGTATLLLQVVFVYVFTGILKAKDPSWQDGSAVYYAVALDTYARPLGVSLLHFPRLMRGLSYATLVFELAGPLLLLATFRRPRLRIATVAVFVVFQASLGTFLSLGLFPWISTAAILPFLPGPFWEKAKQTAAERTTPVDPLPLPARLFALYCLLMVFLWNLGTVFPLPLRNGALWAPARLLALNQGWVMFIAPKVVDGWYVIPGRLEDGSSVDLFHWGQKIRWERPKDIASDYKDFRWTKYMTNLWDRPALRPYFAWYLCYQWNREAAEGRRLKDFEIVYQQELTMPDNPRPPPERVSLGRYLCGTDFSF